MSVPGFKCVIPWLSACAMPLSAMWLASAANAQTQLPTITVHDSSFGDANHLPLDSRNRTGSRLDL